MSSKCTSFSYHNEAVLGLGIIGAQRRLMSQIKLKKGYRKKIVSSTKLAHRTTMYPERCISPKICSRH